MLMHLSWQWVFYTFIIISIIINVFSLIPCMEKDVGTMESIDEEKLDSFFFLYICHHICILLSTCTYMYIYILVVCTFIYYPSSCVSLHLFVYSFPFRLITARLSEVQSAEESIEWLKINERKSFHLGLRDSMYEIIIKEGNILWWQAVSSVELNYISHYYIQQPLFFILIIGRECEKDKWVKEIRKPWVASCNLSGTIILTGSSEFFHPLFVTLLQPTSRDSSLLISRHVVGP